VYNIVKEKCVTKQEINWLCNYQGIYNKKEGKIYFIGNINGDKDGRVIPVCDNTNPFSKKASTLMLRDSDLLSDDWSYSVPYEE